MDQGLPLTRPSLDKGVRNLFREKVPDPFIRPRTRGREWFLLKIMAKSVSDSSFSLHPSSFMVHAGGRQGQKVLQRVEIQRFHHVGIEARVPGLSSVPLLSVARQGYDERSRLWKACAQPPADLQSVHAG